MSKDLTLEPRGCKICNQCMKGAPYDYCCARECGEHIYCIGCKFRNYTTTLLCKDGSKHEE